MGQVPRCLLCDAQIPVNFMLDVPLIPVESRYVATNHTRAPRFEICMVVPIREERNLPHDRQRYDMDGCFTWD